MKIGQENFAQIYETHKNTVYSVIFNYVRNTEDALDLMQDVFVKLLKAELEFDGEEHLKYWLIRVACNESKNFLRKSDHISDEAVSEEIPAMEQSNHNKDLIKHVLALPEKYRIPIHLFYYEDYSIKQISKILDIPEATVKIRLKRGKERLQKNMVKEDWL